MVELEDFDESGLYIVFSDGTRLDLSEETIRSFAHDFLEDPAKVPPEVKKAVDFQACSICPQKESGEFCHALLPTLPFIDKVNHYLSLEPVTVVHRDSATKFVGVKETTLQAALQHVSVLSLIHYCEVGQKFSDFFLGLTPLMEYEEALNRIYLNIYWINGGDRTKIKEVIAEFSQELTLTVRCQVNRLWLICNKDAFINAFCTTHLITHFLSGDMDERLRKALASYRLKSNIQYNH